MGLVYKNGRFWLDGKYVTVRAVAADVGVSENTMRGRIDAYRKGKIGHERLFKPRDPSRICKIEDAGDPIASVSFKGCVLSIYKNRLISYGGAKITHDEFSRLIGMSRCAAINRLDNVAAGKMDIKDLVIKNSIKGEDPLSICNAWLRKSLWA